MKVKDIYTENVKYVDPQTSIEEIAKMMEQQNCGSILIGENDKLTGVITDRDIVIRCIAQGKDPAAMSAEQCQTPEVLYCFEDDTAEEALENMAENKVRRLPVLNNEDDKRLVGIVSFGDLSKACDDKETCGAAIEEISKAA